jgi:hypothetical protein
MFLYQKFSISTTAHFVPSEFPQLEVSIEHIVEQLATQPMVKVEMLLSFVKDHCISSAQVEANSDLAALISTKSLSLQPMEALFEAARKNRVFRTELEHYIRSRFAKDSPVNNLSHSTSQHGL